MIDDLKEGILTHMDEQISDLRTSIPKIVRELVPNYQLPQQQPHSFNTQQHIPQMMPNMMPQLYQASTY